MSKQKEEIMFNHNGDSDIPLKVALYARVSSEEQKQGQNIQSQIDRSDGYTEMFNLRLVDSFIDEAVSGTVPLNERPEGIRLLGAAKDKRFDLVIVYRLDRLARKLKVLLDGWEELDALGVGVRSMTEPLDTSNPLGRFVMQLLGSIAELERETILERTRDGKEASVRRGYWPGGPPPLGYRLVKEELADGKLGRTILEIEEREAGIVRQVFDLYVNSGLGLIKTAAYLNSQGIPTTSAIRKRKDSSWISRSVHAMIQNPTYKGEFSFYRRGNKNSRQEVTASVPVIVDEATWEKAQYLRGRNLTNSPRNSKRFYLLRGIPKCGLCGRTCVGDGSRKRKTYYYTCSGSHSGSAQVKCPGVTIRAEALEHFVWEDIKEFAHNPGKVTDLLAEKIKRDQADTSGIQNQIDELDASVEVIEQRRQWLINNASRGLISDDEAERGLLSTHEELQAIQVRRQTLRGQLDLGEMQAIQIGQVEALLATLREKADNADDATKQGMIEQLVNTMVLTPEEGREVKVSMNYRFASLEDRVTFTSSRRRDTLCRA